MASEETGQVLTPDERTAQIDNAIRAIQQKKPVPEIDFTIHTMEDGTEVSTLERVCKGLPHHRPPRDVLPLASPPHLSITVKAAPIITLVSY